MLCYAMLCYAMLCYAMLCYAMLCYAMLCHACLVFCFLSYAGVPVEVRAGLACWQQLGLLVLKLHQLHEEVRLCQAKQGVNHRKVWLIEVIPYLQHIMIRTWLQSCYCDGQRWSSCSCFWRAICMFCTLCMLCDCAGWCWVGSRGREGRRERVESPHCQFLEAG